MTKATKRKRFMIRQGDVLVMRAPTHGPTSAKAKEDRVWTKDHRDELGRVVLAAGEVTGHHHAIREPGVCLLRAEGVSDAVLSVFGGGDGVKLVHEEHSTIAIPNGRHIVRIQREWGGELSRRVED